MATSPVSDREDRPTTIVRRNPVFLHSLWRSGSTYFFQKFRSSPVPYWCYQEPVHEFVLDRQTKPGELLDVGKGNVELLRHPALERPYLWELHETYDAWKGLLAKSSIYDRYFSTEIDEDLLAYLGALISAAPARPMIQECRTANRIGALRRALGGTHIFLSRNPWDQWWSFKTTSYFDVAAILALNAPEHPEAVARLRASIGFDAFHDADLAKEFHHFSIRPLPPASSYKVFFLLWCLASLEARAHAHINLSIDRLSNDKYYREQKLFELDGLGVSGLELSDVASHRSDYFDQDFEFFIPVEREIFSILMGSGTSKAEIEALQEARRHAEPRSLSTPMRIGDTAQEDVVRLRKIVRRDVTEGVERVKHVFGFLAEREVALSGESAALGRRLADTAARLALSETKREAAERSAETSFETIESTHAEHRHLHQAFVTEVALLRRAHEQETKHHATSLVHAFDLAGDKERLLTEYAAHTADIIRSLQRVVEHSAGALGLAGHEKDELRIRYEAELVRRDALHRRAVQALETRGQQCCEALAAQEARATEALASEVAAWHERTAALFRRIENLDRDNVALRSDLHSLTSLPGWWRWRRRLRETG